MSLDLLVNKRRAIEMRVQVRQHERRLALRHGTAMSYWASLCLGCAAHNWVKSEAEYSAAPVRGTNAAGSDFKQGCLGVPAPITNFLWPKVVN